MLSEFKQKADSKGLTEKNRVQFLRSKGNDVFKLIQDDKIASDRSLSRDPLQ